MKTSKKDPAAIPPADIPTHFLNCENWGNGGRYIYDPTTGTRTPVPDEPEPGAVSPASGDDVLKLTAPAAAGAAVNKEADNG